MDAVTLAMAKAYSDSNRLAYADGGTATFETKNPGEPILADGNIWLYQLSKSHPNAADYDGSEIIIYVYDTVPIKNQFVNAGQLGDGLTAYIMPNNFEWMIVFIADKATVFEDEEEGVSIVFPSEGIYVALAMDPDSIATSNRIKLEIPWGTVKTIDPKFLPGVCLPVVNILEIDTLTKEESAQLTACIGMPCIIKTPYFAALFQYAYEPDGHLFVNAVTNMSVFSADGVTWAKQ